MDKEQYSDQKGAPPGGTSGVTTQTANPYGTPEKAADTASANLGDTVSSAANQAKEQLSSATGQAKDKAGRVMDQAKQQAMSQADSRKGQAAGSVDQVAQALHHTSDELEGSHSPVAQYVDQAAAQLDRFSGYLRNTSVEDMIGDAERFARQQPALFIGGAFTLGLLAARFLKSSGAEAGNGGYSGSYRGYPGGYQGASGRYPGATGGYSGTSMGTTTGYGYEGQATDYAADYRGSNVGASDDLATASSSQRPPADVTSTETDVTAAGATVVPDVEGTSASATGSPTSASPGGSVPGRPSASRSWPQTPPSGGNTNRG